MPRTRARIVVAMYALSIATPLLLMVPAPSPGDGWSVFATAVGFIAYATLTLQVVTASRLPWISAPFGLDVVLRFHRVAGIALLVSLVVHLVVVFATLPWARSWFWPVDGPLEAQAGMAATLAVAVLAATSVRRPAWLRYERWRQLHVAMTVVAVIASYLHALRSSPYSSAPQLRAYVLVAFVAAGVALVYLRLWRTVGAVRRPWVIESVVDEGAGVTSVQLEPLGHAGLRFAPGQFAWLKVAGSAVSLTEHPFSLATSAERPDRPGFGIKALGDFTSGVGALRPGTRVLVDGPHGDPLLPVPGADVVCVVGGIGVTPALSHVRTLADRPRDPRRVHLVYGIAGTDEVPFLAELEALAAPGGALAGRLAVHVVASAPGAGWAGHTGFVSAPLLAQVLEGVDVGACSVLVCGPPAMEAPVTAALDALGVPRAHVRIEGFALA